jgi:hypothetical protein
MGKLYIDGWKILKWILEKYTVKIKTGLSGTVCVCACAWGGVCVCVCVIINNAISSSDNIVSNGRMIIE